MLTVRYRSYGSDTLMKLLLIGDVVGKPGRSALLDRLQDLKEQHAIDFTVMNAENVAGGFSITAAIAELLFSSGIDVMTSGNHIFDKHEVIEYIQKQPRLLRPANYPPAHARKRNVGGRGQRRSHCGD